MDAFNEVAPEEEVKDAHKEYVEQANQLREHQKELKDVYRRLEEKADGRKKREFVEPKVQHLWQTALESNFTEKELAALKEELFHFESRLLKLSHMYAEHAVGNEKQKVRMPSGKRLTLNPICPICRSKRTRTAPSGCKSWRETSRSTHERWKSCSRSSSDKSTSTSNCSRGLPTNLASSISLSIVKGCQIYKLEKNDNKQN